MIQTDALTQREKKIEYDQRLGKRIICYIVLIHLGLLTMFLHYHIVFMVYVNCGSLATYIIVLSLINKMRYEFLTVTYLEILIHSCLATICIGWEYGFQLYCFSMIPVFFYCDYLARELGGKPVTPFLFCGVDVAAYVIMRFYTQNHVPYYLVMDAKLPVACYTVNTLIVFTFSILYVSTFEAMTRRSEKKLLNAANRDALTGLRNRRSMETLMCEATAGSLVNGTELAVAMLDINDFKSVNDSYGHLAGDRVLCAVAAQIADLEDDTVHVCRWGGDELLLLSTGDNAFVILKDRTDALVRALKNWSVNCDGIKVLISITAGCAEYNGGSTLEDAVRRADEKLYEGKDRRIGLRDRRNDHNIDPSL